MLGIARPKIQSDKKKATANGEDDKNVDVRRCHGKIVPGSARGSEIL